jgi:hypothetical protein
VYRGGGKGKAMPERPGPEPEARAAAAAVLQSRVLHVASSKWHVVAAPHNARETKRSRTPNWQLAAAIAIAIAVWRLVDVRC